MKRFLAIILFALPVGLIAQDYFFQVRKILNAYPFGNPDDGQLEHTIYTFSLDSAQQLAITFSNRKNNVCHACSTQMSVFLIDHNKIAVSIINVDNIGSWGSPPPKDAIFVNKQGNGYIIGIETGYLAQGYVTRSLSCYYFVGNNFCNLGFVQIAESDEGAIIVDSTNKIKKWEAKYRFIQHKDAPPDLLLLITGMEKGKKISRTEFYTVKNSKYVKF